MLNQTSRITYAQPTAQAHATSNGQRAESERAADCAQKRTAYRTRFRASALLPRSPEQFYRRQSTPVSDAQTSGVL